MEVTSKSKINPSHPYYLHELDSPITKIVNSVFDGSNYRIWSRLMHLALSAKNKLGFINGSYPKPSSESPLVVAWTTSNAMVMCWILNSVSSEIAETVIYSNTAKDMWNELERRFGESRGERMFRLYKELVGLKQGSDDIVTYFTKLRSIWNEMDNVNEYLKCECECDCGAMLKLQKFEEDKKVFQLLSGLNECYVGVRERILMMSPLPSLDQAYNLLRQEECMIKYR